ncbi:MAG: carboxypeptidase-like regulatory domain-containing protein [Bacteroidales bacterium]|nr:carboxypeptidase-like regulatory domain-containing protein [Bacteroidales bacterium]
MKHFLTSMFAIFLAIAANAQNFPVRGKVTEVGTNEPLVGVCVYEVGTMNGTLTDLDGNYEFRVSSPGATIEADCIGFIPERKSYAPVLNFELWPDLDWPITTPDQSKSEDNTSRLSKEARKKS